jgi:hypothetical protein
MRRRVHPCARGVRPSPRRCRRRDRIADRSGISSRSPSRTGRRTRENVQRTGDRSPRADREPFLQHAGAQEAGMATIQHSTNGSSLAEVVDRILDRGCVIDAFVRVTLVGIELLAIEARVVIASVDTWLKYAEAVGLTTTFDQMAEIPA